MLMPQVSAFGHAAKIPADLGGKVNTLGGDSTGFCAGEKKSSYEHVSNSEWLPR
jgi:hypothetical protein